MMPTHMRYGSVTGLAMCLRTVLPRIGPATGLLRNECTRKSMEFLNWLCNPALCVHLHGNRTYFYRIGLSFLVRQQDFFRNYVSFIFKQYAKWMGEIFPITILFFFRVPDASQTCEAKVSVTQPICALVQLFQIGLEIHAATKSIYGLRRNVKKKVA